MQQGKSKEQAIKESQAIQQRNKWGDFLCR
jgi:hypothetical protein